MITWLTWRIGVMILGGLLAAAAGGWLYDGITNRVELRLLRGDRDALSKTVDVMNQNIGTCHANVSNLKGGIDAARADIDKLAKATVDGDKRTAEAMAAASKALRTVETNTDRLLQAPRTTMPGTIESCRVGERILRGGVP